MKCGKSNFTACLALGALAASATPSGAQEGRPAGWIRSVTAETIYRGERDINGGGDFAVSRNRAGFRLTRSLGEGNSVSLGFSGGVADYDFDGVINPWGQVREFSLSMPMVFGITDAVTALVVPIVRYAGESGVALGDGDTAGLILGARWKVNDSFSIGPGFGVFTTLDRDDDYDVFPFLLFNWQVSERVSVGTGDGFGASQGPGVGMNYKLQDNLTTSLFFRTENMKFRLDNDGSAPGGVGKDEVMAVVAAISYRPSKNLELSGFAGVEFGGKITLKDNSGATVDKRDYDTAPVVGAKFSIKF